MENFFNQFRQNWHNRPAPDLDEHDWLALQKRLEVHTDKRRMMPLLWWLALPLFIGSIGFNLFFFKQVQVVREHLYLLKTQRDTVILTRVVFQTDTVFRTRILREQAVKYLPIANVKDNSEQQLPSPSAYVLGERETKNDTTATPQTEMVDHQTAPGIFERDFSTKLLPPLPLRSMRVPLPDLLNFAQVPVTIKKQTKTIHHYLHDIRPTGFSLAVTSGLALPSERDLQSHGGWSVGISTSLNFPKNWRLWADVTHFQLNFLARRMDEHLGVPIIDPPADDFVFKEADVPQPSRQFLFGLDKFFFVPKRRVEPFLGLGLGAVQRLSHEVSYDFVRQADGVEWTIDKSFSGGAPRFGFGLTRAGLSYGFLKNWRAELTGTYRFHFDKPTTQMPNVVGLTFGLRRTF